LRRRGTFVIPTFPAALIGRHNRLKPIIARALDSTPGRPDLASFALPRLAVF
jgi:hypothetical protein